MKITVTFDLPDMPVEDAAANTENSGLSAFKKNHISLFAKVESLVHSIQKDIISIDNAVEASEDYPAEEIADILGLMTSDVLNLGAVVRVLSDALDNDSNADAEAEDTIETLLEIYAECEGYLDFIRDAYSFEAGILFDEDAEDDEDNDDDGNESGGIDELFGCDLEEGDDAFAHPDMCAYLNDSLVALGLAPFEYEAEEEEGNESEDGDEEEVQVNCTVETDEDAPDLTKNPDFWAALTSVAETVLGMLSD